MKKSDAPYKIFSTATELGKYVAGWMVEYISDVLKKQDRFTIALSGGNTPKTLYQLLASEEYRHKIEWSKLHFFWGDERCVPFEDDLNNAGMAFDTLLNHVPVIKEQVHVMRTDIDPASSAKEYEKILKSYFENSPVSFDLVLLGLGDNGHTLSLFPGYDNIHEKEKRVISFYLTEQKMYRITLTPPIINKATRVAFLVTGADKANALEHVLYGRHEPGLYPAQLIQPFVQKPYWFIDKAANI